MIINYMSLWERGTAIQLHFKILTITIILLFCFTSTTLAFGQNDDKIVVFHTDFGHLAIELFSDDAPNTAENFLNLADSGFYDETIFHRIIKGFMIQGGDPNSKESDQSKWGQGGTGDNLKAEFNDIKHNRGIVSMARSMHPDSASSQFFIVHDRHITTLDEQYTVFGRIITQESYDTLDKLANLETTTKDIPLELEKAKIKKTEIVTRSSLENTLTLDAPERVETSTIGDISRYYSKDFEFGFMPQTGWLLQSYLEPGPDDPVLIALGIAKDGVTPNITFQAYNKDDCLDAAGTYSNTCFEDTFEDFFKPRLDSYHELDDGIKFDILSEERKQIAGHNGLEIIATQAVDGPMPDGSKNLMLKFKQVFIDGSKFYYIITYANHEKHFDEDLVGFDNTMDSFAVTVSSASDKNSQITNPEKDVIILDSNFEETEQGGCLIATATFGSEMAPQVQLLREIRDNIVLQTQSGISFMTAFNQFYYSFSPTIADYERENPVFKEAVKLTITPLLASLTLLQFADIDSESEMLGYGIGVILLNIGIYIIAPVAFIMKIRKLQ